MWDESDENKKVSCPFCDSEENCPHLLAVSDGSSLVGGFAYNHEDSFYSRVYDAFQKRLAEGDADQQRERAGSGGGGNFGANVFHALHPVCE